MGVSPVEPPLPEFLREIADVLGGEGPCDKVPEPLRPRFLPDMPHHVAGEVGGDDIDAASGKSQRLNAGAAPDFEDP